MGKYHLGINREYGNEYIHIYIYVYREGLGWVNLFFKRHRRSFCLRSGSQAQNPKTCFISLQRHAFKNTVREQDVIIYSSHHCGKMRGLENMRNTCSGCFERQVADWVQDFKKLQRPSAQDRPGYTVEAESRGFQKEGASE